MRLKIFHIDFHQMLYMIYFYNIGKNDQILVKGNLTTEIQLFLCNFFLFYAFCSLSKNNLSKVTKIVSYVLALIFKFMIHFKLVFVCITRKVLMLIIFLNEFQFFQHPLLKWWYFPIEVLLYLFKNYLAVRVEVLILYSNLFHWHIWIFLYYHYTLLIPVSLCM